MLSWNKKRKLSEIFVDGKLLINLTLLSTEYDEWPQDSQIILQAADFNGDIQLQPSFSYPISHDHLSSNQMKRISIEVVPQLEEGEYRYSMVVGDPIQVSPKMVRTEQNFFKSNTSLDNSIVYKTGSHSKQQRIVMRSRE